MITEDGTTLHRRPEPGDVWEHHSGRHYEVLFITNDPGLEEKPKADYPETVVYQNITNKRRYSGTLSDWHRRMTFSCGPAAPVARNWNEIIGPLVSRLNLAVRLKQEAVYDAEGSKAMASILLGMAWENDELRAADRDHAAANKGMERRLTNALTEMTRQRDLEHQEKNIAVNNAVNAQLALGIAKTNLQSLVSDISSMQNPANRDWFEGFSDYELDDEGEALTAAIEWPNLAISLEAAEAFLKGATVAAPIEKTEPLYSVGRTIDAANLGQISSIVVRSIKTPTGYSMGGPVAYTDTSDQAVALAAILNEHEKRKSPA